MAHTFIKVVNGYEIRHWSLGDVYYIAEGLNWTFESKSLREVEDHANSLPNGKSI